MWLDRFSPSSAPSESPPPQIRNYSPVPGRSSHRAPGQRSGLGLTAGGSSISLGLSSNGSNVSLPTTSRMPNGSSLRQEHRPSPNFPDPLNLLRSILGISPTKEGSEDASEEQRLAEMPRELATNIEFGGLSLEDYANEEDEELNAVSTPVPQQLSSFDERERYQSLHKAIEDCDDVLKSVESYLTNFQNDLGAVSAEIESLQSRSSQLNAKLENRRKVEKLLGPAVEEISISPVTVRTISEGPVDDNWLRALAELESRSITIARQKSGTIKAIEDVKPLLEDLKVKAVERIRDFIVAQIKALRSPNINAQIIQQQTLLKYKDLYSFLARNSPILAEEIGQAYINTMKWYYTSNFTRYQQALNKLSIHVIDQTEVLGSDSSPARRNVLASTKISPPQHDVFIIGRRPDILKSKSKDAISAYLAEENKTHHYLETPFYNFNLALIDNVCSEHSIFTSLFPTRTFHETSRKLTEIFDPTFTLGHALTKQLIEPNTDCLGVLLCVRINQHLAFSLQRHKVPIADSYINGTTMLLWPRFQILMDLHCESLKKVAPATPTPANRGAAAAFSLIGNDNAAAKTSVAPHPITQKFAQFLHGILVLSSDAADDEPVAHSLARLRGEYEAAMGRLAKGLGDAGKRCRFLYYNYSLVLTIIGDTRGRLAEEQKARFEELVIKGKGGREI